MLISVLVPVLLLVQLLCGVVSTRLHVRALHHSRVSPFADDETLRRELEAYGPDGLVRLMVRRLVIACMAAYGVAALLVGLLLLLAPGYSEAVQNLLIGTAIGLTAATVIYTAAVVPWRLRKSRLASSPTLAVFAKEAYFGVRHWR